MYVTKKAQNTIDGPVYPFIQKDPFRFFKVPKFWNVKPGDVLLDQADNPQSFDGSVLAVARDENQTHYGKRSYIPKVNKEFRPPLVDPEYDLPPLSRIPRPRTQLRINPQSTAETQNIHGEDVSSYIDSRVMAGSVRPSFSILIEKPLTDVLPDLTYKNPQVSVDSNVQFPLTYDLEHNEIILEKRNPDVYANAGYKSCFEEGCDVNDIQLEYVNPQVNGNSKINMPYKYIENMEHHTPLNYNGPQVSVHSGIATPYSKLDNYSSIQLAHNRPQTSMNIQANSPFSTQEYKPQVIKTQNPIRLNYKTDQNIDYRCNNANKNPNIRQTLHYNRNINANANVPTNVPAMLESFTPKLKSKK